MATKSRLVPYAGQEPATVRTRSRAPRALQLDAPVSSPANDERMNATLLDAKFTPLLQTYALANAAKNKGTREEKAAKDVLNKEMVKEGITEFSKAVEVNGDVLTFSARIEEADEEIIDPAKVLTLVGNDLQKFLSVVTVTKSRLEEVLGKNAVIVCTSSRKKPAALSVKQVK